MSPAGVARALALVAVGAVVGAADIGAADVATTPIDGPSTLTRLATATNGQAVFGLDGTDGAMHMVDPFTPGRARQVVTAPGPGVPRPVAIAVIDSSVIAAVCREGDGWHLRTWRLAPDQPVAAERPLQSLSLGAATGGVDLEVDVAVGRGRDWIAVSGLPAPLAPVLRAPLAGVRVGPLTSRSCPVIAGGARPVAVAVGPRDELVLVEHDTASSVVVSYHDHTGRCVLRLPTGLVGLQDISFAPEGTALWVAGNDAAGDAGLWRLDATLRNGRQGIRPELVLARSALRALAAPTGRVVVLSHGVGGEASAGAVERLDLPADETRDRRTESGLDGGSAGTTDEGGSP